MKNTIYILIILLFAACSAKERETFAHITQRRLDKAGKLVISYQFSNNGKLVYDSVEVINKIVPHDSVRVIYSLEHPQESRLLLR